MATPKRKRPKVPGDDKLGQVKIPLLRECPKCKFKPVPINSNCPNCGSNQIGGPGGEGNSSTKTARQLQEVDDWF